MNCPKCGQKVTTRSFIEKIGSTGELHGIDFVPAELKEKKEAIINIIDHWLLKMDLNLYESDVEYLKEQIRKL